jgi:hypothetical protein
MNHLALAIPEPLRYFDVEGKSRCYKNRGSSLPILGVLIPWQPLAPKKALTARIIFSIFANLQKDLQTLAILHLT